MTSWLLVHSPLLGPGSWRPVAERLDSAVVPDLRPALDEPDFVAAQARLAADAVRGDSVAIAGHSGAGPLLPVVADALRAVNVRVAESVFVDAGLPHPGSSRLETLPSQFAAQLTGLETDGVLPKWPSWFPPGVVDELLPDDNVRAEFLDDCPALPWRLFTEPMPDADADLLGRCSYIRLSAAYDDAAATATARGWPVRSLDSDHLALLTDAASVADALQNIVREP